MEKISEGKQKSSQKIICGCSIIFAKEVQMYKLYARAKNACDSAQFAGIGIVVDHKEKNWKGKTQMLQQIRYQRNCVTESVEELEQLVQSGEILLDELWKYILMMRQAKVDSQSEANRIGHNCESAEDLLRTYKNCIEFFEILREVLTFDENKQMMRQILEYIDCHYMENKTAAVLGNELGISQGYLSQLVKKETGKTYSELVQQKKLEKAKELLRYSEKTVGQIAEEVGYSDYYYFTKTFKRLMKMSPSEYRKKEKYKNDEDKTKNKKSNQITI